MKGWVPIYPTTSEWSTPSTKKDDSMTNHSPRTMVPLKLCYAWTIWKAQGQTIRGKVVVDLGKTEKEHGLSYTAFSRVTRFNDIGVIGGLSRDRLIGKVRNHSKMTP